MTASHAAAVVALSLRLELCSDDELRVVDRVLAGLELGRQRYGALDLGADDRNWLDEASDESRDGLVYRAMHVEQARRSRRDEQQARVNRGLAELRDAAMDLGLRDELVGKVR